MAEALGWPDTADRVRRHRRPRQRPRGLGVGRPSRVGPVPARQDQPQLLHQRSQLHDRRVLRGDRQDARPHARRTSIVPSVVEFASDVESAVVHYGDITMTFLNNWFATDVRGTSLTYASAVAVEEKSVIDYNLGNPDGELVARRDAPRRPRARSSRSIPSEGTLYSDNPFIILDTEWVDARTAGRRAGVRGVRADARRTRRRCSSSGSARTTRASRWPIRSVAANGVDPTQTAAELEVPDPGGAGARSSTRGPSSARRRGCCSCSTSRVRWVTSPTTAETKLDLAKEAAISALDQFKDADEVGLWVFSTDLFGATDPNYRELVPIGADRHPAAADRRADRPPSSRPTAHRCTTSPSTAYTAMLDDVRPRQDQRHRVPHRRGQRRRRSSRTTSRSSTDLIDQLQAGSEGAAVAAGAGVHDLLR